VLLLVLLLGVGCASGAGARAMVALDALPAGCPVSGALHAAVALGSVGGGRETGGLDNPHVSDANLARALRLTLEHHELLGADDAPFRLDVQLVELAQPTRGYTMEVVAFVRYRLVAQPSGELVLDDVIPGACTREYEDAWIGYERLRLANEGAVRASLGSFLETLCGAAAAGALNAE